MTASDPFSLRRLILQILRRGGAPPKHSRAVDPPVRPTEPTEPKEPTSPKDTEAIRRGRFEAQLDVIRRAFQDDVALAGGSGNRSDDDGGETAFLYRPGHLLVRADRVEDVSDFVSRRHGIDGPGVERIRQPVRGLVLVRVLGGVGADSGDDAGGVLGLLDDLEESFGDDSPDGPIATPDHVLYVTFPRLCPATEPEVPRSPKPWPPIATNQRLGHGVRVAVVDTGLWQPAVTSPSLPWLHGVLADPTDLETIDPHHIHAYGGHGTFVSGVVRCMAPATRVEVEGVLTKGGAIHESEIIEQLDQALHDGDHPQLISISAGTHTRHNIALLSFEMLAAAYGLDDGEETLIVAAAGNDGSDDPFWPAAFPWVIGVGAVDPDGGVADYSNVGRWVDVYARGTDIVNAFPTGTYVCHEPPNVGQPRVFDSLAQWSGTSFSTPIVTGLIAARMSTAGQSARAAWADVRSAGTTSIDPRAGRINRVGPLS